jgi:hypothetical protein
MINIITPCSRPLNLLRIAGSINIPADQYRWLVVFDGDTRPNVNLPNNAEYYEHKDALSTSGNSQRNFALDLIDNGLVYFNDDDTIIHPDLWDNIKDKTDHDFISFAQAHKNGSLRLSGKNIAVDHIDSHNFIVDHSICKNIRFPIDRYDADGYFAVDCYRQAKNSIYIPMVLSIYNQLR